MTARLDVPALLREAGRRSSPPDLTEEEAAFLIRLADAVEAYHLSWDKEPLHIIDEREIVVLALLRGKEVEP